MNSFQTNPEYLALLETVRTNPWDDAPRGIIADWIEEHDDPERAEFIQVQLAKTHLESLSGTEHYWRDLAIYLRRREDELFESHKCRWFGESWAILYCGEPSEDVDGQFPELAKAFVTRGFVSEVRLTCAAFMGVTCDKCQGHRTVRQPGTGGRPDTRIKCRHCNGTGRLPGLAGRLFASQPIMRVELTDKRPTKMQANQRWGYYRRSPVAHDDVSPELFDCLPSFDIDIWDKASSWKWWPSESLALAALSDACVAYGRSLAGLPPLVK